MKRKTNQKGFTLAETLIVVAIIMVLAALIFIAVFQYMRSLTQLEYDNAAKEIFVVTQNRLSMAKSQGYLGKTKFGTPEEGNEGVYYYIVGSTNPYGDEESLLDVLLPFASVDETLRSGGSYVIRYDKNAGAVLDVFYSSRSGRFGHSYTAADYLNSTKPLVDYRNPDNPNDYRGEDNKSARRRYTDGSVLGYYGGTAAGTALSKLPLGLTLNVVNAEKLTATVCFRSGVTAGSSNSDRIVLQLKITGKTSGNTRVVKILNGVGGEFLKAEYPIVLDDISRLEDGKGLHFAQLCGTTDTVNLQDCSFVSESGQEPLLPGEDIEISVVCFSKEKEVEMSPVPVASANSLFSNDTDVSGHTAAIENIRHLENLSPAISQLSGITAEFSITKAEQKNDLSWTEFKTTVAARNDTGADDVCVYDSSNRSTQPGTYAPVTPYGGLEYDGGGYTIREIQVDTRDETRAPAGLFGSLNGANVHDLVLLDFDIKGSGDAGALAGSVGGNSSVDACAAVAYVRSAEGAAGGLIGTASSTNVSSSYSAGHTKDGQYMTGVNDEIPVNVVSSNSAAGGLIGAEVNVTVTTCYSTCSAKGNVAGGLIGSANRGSISNSYATGYVDGTTKGAFIGQINEHDPSLRNDSYFGIINPGTRAVGTDTAETSAREGLGAFDANLTSYQSFVGATRAAAEPADAMLTLVYGGEYALKTIAQMGGDSSMGTHYGDWPAPELLAQNEPST